VRNYGIKYATSCLRPSLGGLLIEF